MNKVFVIGGANVDISARSYEPLRDYDSNPGKVSYSFGGVAHNIAANMAGYGLPVEYITAFSTDNWGGLLQDECVNRSISIEYSQIIPDEGTSLYLAVVEPDGEMKVAIADMEILSRLDIDRLGKVLSELDRDDLLVLDTNLTEEQIGRIIELAHCRIYADPISIAKSARIMNYLDRLEMLKPNNYEAEIMSGLRLKDENDYENMLDWFIKQGSRSIVISMGARGVIGRKGEEAFHLSNADIEIVNTTGAGDAFLAGVVYAYTKNIPFPKTAQYGLMAARATLMSPKPVNPDIANILL